MNPRILLVEFSYRNRNGIWLAPGFIESIAEVKGGSVVGMISGTKHDLLDTHVEIVNKITERR